jgi:Domain of unknown function (DUF4157)
MRSAAGPERKPPPGGPTTASEQTAGELLAPTTRQELEPALGADFSDVRVHTDGPSTARLGASAYTVGTDVVFAPGRFRPDTDQGVRLIAHELTHVVQQRRSGVRRLQAQRPPGSWMADPDESEADRTSGGVGARRRPPPLDFTDDQLARIADCILSLGPLHRADCYDMVAGWRLAGETLHGRPEAERRELKVHKRILDASWAVGAESFFGAKPAAAPAVPAGMKVVVGNSVDGSLTRGAEALGAFFADQIGRVRDPAKTVLPPDHTFDIAVRTAGQVFRLTRIGAPLLLVEQVGPILAGPATVPDAVVTDPTFAVGAKTFQLGPNWHTNDLAGLRAALALFPAGALPPTGTRFQRDGVKVCSPADVAAGTCDPNWSGLHQVQSGRHVITLFDGAFAADARRDGTWPVLYTTIAHEVGHAQDEEPLDRSVRAFNVPTTGTLAQRKARVLAARSLSGTRYRQGTTTPTNITFDEDQEATSRTSDFRQAAIADGLVVDAAGALSHGLTTYGEKNWKETFAESFSIYLADPELLRDIRPHVFAYFTTRFPR